jgi:molecular chaperone DnaK (HSP70)
MGTFQIDFGESRASKIVGIDLGTTNSLIACMELTGPRILEDGEGRKIVPSIVSLSEDGRVIACDVARELQADQPRTYPVLGEMPDGPRRNGYSG